MAAAVTDQTFDAEVLASKEPVLVDFWAEWCPPCHTIAPFLDELSAELDGRVKIVKLDADDNPSTVARYGVRSLPTLMVFKGGEPVDLRIGAMPRAGLGKWLMSHAA